MGFTDESSLAVNVSAMIGTPTSEAAIDPNTIVSRVASCNVILSHAKPKVISTAFSGNAAGVGSAAYQFELPAAWNDGFSRIISVEYPAGQQVRSYAHPSHYELYPHEDIPTHLHFSQFIPATGSSNILMLWSDLWTLGATTDIPEHYQPAWEFFLAYDLCGIYAREYGHSTSKTIEGDSVDRLSKARDWLELGKDYLARAENVLRVDLSPSARTAAAKFPPPGMPRELTPDPRFPEKS